MLFISSTAARLTLAMHGICLSGDSRASESAIKEKLGVDTTITCSRTNDDFEFGMEVQRKMQQNSDEADKKFAPTFIDRVDVINMNFSK